MSFNNNCQRQLRRLKIVCVRSRAQETSADIAALTSCRFERVQRTFLKVVLPIRHYLCRFRMLRNCIRTAENPLRSCDAPLRKFAHATYAHICTRMFTMYMPRMYLK